MLKGRRPNPWPPAVGCELLSIEIKELCSPGCAIAEHQTEKASKALSDVIEATEQGGSNVLWEDLSPGVGEKYLCI